MDTADLKITEVRAKVDENGRVEIPAQIREVLGIEAGQYVFFCYDGQTLKIESWMQRLRRAQDLVRKYVDPSVSLSDELIAERREEFRREMEK